LTFIIGNTVVVKIVTKEELNKRRPW